MTILKILIFLIMCLLGTVCLIRGFFKYATTENAKPTIVITTSIKVAIINIIGSILCVYIDKII